MVFLRLFPCGIHILDRTKDLGKDGQTTSSTAYNTRAGMHSNIAIDAFGYTLGYFWKSSGSYGKDYVPINSSAQSLYGDVTALNNPADTLHNGNIKDMATALMAPNGTSLPTLLPLIDNHYRYDQLNRIVSSNSYIGTSTTAYTGLTTTAHQFQNTFSYDANGNIQTQLRNGNSTTGTGMDDLAYHYWNSTHTSTYSMNADGTVPVNATNQLAYVDDAASSSYTDDIDDQSAANYTYYNNGELKSDASEEINVINWNVYGKIKSVERTSGSVKKELNFTYDATGQRVLKIAKERDASTGIKTQDHWAYTYYVRDAQGNVMATYNRTFTDNGAHTQVTDKMELSETHLYGSTRIGVKDRSQSGVYSDVVYNYSSINIDKTFHTTSTASTAHLNDPELAAPKRKLGYKNYELCNHLGNVLVTVSDRKLIHQTASVLDYYMADVRTTSDYSAFGAPLPGRNYSATSYRYKMNGQEKEDEIAVGIYAAEYWEYDSRLGRRWNADPISTPSYSLYSVFMDSPIALSDRRGKYPYPDNEKENNVDNIVKNADGSYTITETTTITTTTSVDKQIDNTVNNTMGFTTYKVKTTQEITTITSTTTIDANGHMTGNTATKTVSNEIFHDIVKENSYTGEIISADADCCYSDPLISGIYPQNTTEGTFIGPFATTAMQSLSSTGEFPVYDDAYLLNNLEFGGGVDLGGGANSDHFTKAADNTWHDAMDARADKIYEATQTIRNSVSHGGKYTLSTGKQLDSTNFIKNNYSSYQFNLSITFKSSFKEKAVQPAQSKVNQ